MGIDTWSPAHGFPNQPEEPEDTDHDDYSVCIECGCANMIIVHEEINGVICECATKCCACGYNDYWIRGYYESNNDL